MSLIVLVSAALFVRAYWNLDAATEEGTFVLSGGSDPYYHKHAIDRIQENGFRMHVDDPMLNYPYGAINPNPPLYQYSVAIAGAAIAPFFGGDLETATWHALLWSTAILGALTVIPIYFIGKTLFDRRVGLVAALFWTLSTSSIDSTGTGLADHDAMVVLFSTTAFLFYIKAIERFRGDANWVASWRDSATIGPGISRFFRERRVALGYAALAGISTGLVALTWKGFPYLLGIFFIYAGIQMVVDHWRNRDSTGVFLGTFIAMTVGTLVALPYYSAVGLMNFIVPVWFIIGAFVVGGLVLVPTRDLPTILVMPAVAIAGILGVIAAFFVVPQVAQSLLYSTVYFKQTAIYETIAEAHPADFSSMVFAVGPIPFFLALIAWFGLAFTLKRHPQRAMLFALVWAAIAAYMAHSAIRFLFDAVPVISVFAAFGTVWVIDWLNFGKIRRSLAAHQGNTWQGVRRGTTGWHVTGVILIVGLLVVPNTLLAADAALPPKAEADLYEGTDSTFMRNFIVQRMGAFGQGFIPGYWHDALTWLDQHDSHIEEPTERPAFLAWWDYGHWAIAVGRHPAVADNFQNGYEMAADFLLAQSEAQAVQLMAGRMIDLPHAGALEALESVGSPDPAADMASLQRREALPHLDLEASTRLLSILEENTGKSIRYFATDIRMLPYDNPQTGFIDQSSIFYAPVRLAGQNPDDFVELRYQIEGVGQTVSQAQYEEMARNPIRETRVVAETYIYHEPFFQSMFWRGYAGEPLPGGTRGDSIAQVLNVPQPGSGLEHFRVVYMGERLLLDRQSNFAAPGVVILEYYRGAIVEGVVAEEGTPLGNVTVTAYDDYGHVLIEQYTPAFRERFGPDDLNIPHASTTSGEDGSYRIVAPFAMDGRNVTIVATRDGVEVGRTALAITREDAQAQRQFTANIDVERGSIEGIAFIDADQDGVYDATNDTLAAGVTLRIGEHEVVTGDDGSYRIESISSGSHAVTIDSDTHLVNQETSRVTVQPRETTTLDVSLVPRPSTWSGTVYADLDDDAAMGEGEELPFLTLTFEADPTVEGNTAVSTTELTASDGSYTVQLESGTYVVRASFVDDAGDAYTLEAQIVVTAGPDVTRDFELTRAE